MRNYQITFHNRIISSFNSQLEISILEDASLKKKALASYQAKAFKIFNYRVTELFSLKRPLTEAEEKELFFMLENLTTNHNILKAYKF
ncbi:MAG: hypothetical protein WC460_06265 [Patescibacteria group bacterium]